MKAVVRIVLGGLVLLFAFTSLYLAAFHAPRPRASTSASSARPPSGAAAAALDPARGAFDVERYATERAARRALLDTDVHARARRRPHPRRRGARRRADRDGLTRAPGRRARRDRPATCGRCRAGDRRGLSSLFAVIGTVIPSLVFGALLSLLGRGLPARMRWAAVLVFAAGAGLVAAFDADVLVGAFSGHFLGARGGRRAARARGRARPRTGSGTSAARPGSSPRSCCCCCSASARRAAP